MSVNSKMTSIANEVRTLAGVSDKLSLDSMATHISDSNQEIQDQTELIGLIADALKDKAVSGGEVEVVLQNKTVTPTKATQSVTADSGYTGLGKVTVQAIPSEYIVPSGTLEVTENGTHDVTEYVSVNVTVAGSGEPDPKEQYQRVEYITSAEAETFPYIITDICATNTIGAEIVASYPKMQDRIPMGSRQDSNATRFYVVYPLSTSSIYYGFNTGVTISCSLKVDTIYRCQTNFLNSRLVNVYDKDGVRKGGGSISVSLSPSHTVPISIFGYHSASSGVISSKREYKLYSARISEGHEVIREYIPCYRKSDGEIGLYEKFTGQFLMADGGGSFTKGADVEWDN